MIPSSDIDLISITRGRNAGGSKENCRLFVYFLIFFFINDNIFFVVFRLINKIARVLNRNGFEIKQKIFSARIPIVRFLSQKRREYQGIK
jgi:hypothetical protein